MKSLMSGIMVILAIIQINTCAQVSSKGKRPKNSSSYSISTPANPFVLMLFQKCAAISLGHKPTLAFASHVAEPLSPKRHANFEHDSIDLEQKSFAP